MEETQARLDVRSQLLLRRKLRESKGGTEHARDMTVYSSLRNPMDTDCYGSSLWFEAYAAFWHFLLLD
uniref:IBB domain-containing protein n=1 Tax=Trichuris muris TaxID=70415 RepID=A0A5S6QSM7_TRIMR